MTIFRATKRPAPLRRLSRIGAPLVVLTMIGVQPAASQLLPTDRNEPLDITSERFEGENDLAVSTFLGNVRVVQGEAIMTSERLVLKQDDNGDVTNITATGRVRYSNGVEAITGERAVYNGGARTITITGKVLITQGDQIMAGERLVYWVDSGKVKFTAAEGRRVRGVFRPSTARPGS